MGILKHETGISLIEPFVMWLTLRLRSLEMLPGRLGIMYPGALIQHMHTYAASCATLPLIQKIRVHENHHGQHCRAVPTP